MPQEALFSTLIPDSSAKALSRYTAMVDSQTREILDKLAMATDNARIKLKVGLPVAMRPNRKNPISCTFSFLTDDNSLYS